MSEQTKEPHEMSMWMACLIVGLLVGTAMIVINRTRGPEGGNAFGPGPVAGNSLQTASRTSAHDEPPADPHAEAADITAQATRVWQAGQFAAAEGQFNRAVELDPANAEAWNGLGWCRFNGIRDWRFPPAELARLDGAEEAFKKCVEVDPENLGALNGLGQVCLIRRRFDEAERHFLKAAAAPAAWQGLARLYLLQGRFKDAEKWAARAAELSSDGYAKLMRSAARSRQVDPSLRKFLEMNLVPATKQKGTQAS